MIHLTNATEQHQGNPIFINHEHITAVYEVARESGGSLVTIVYGGPTGTTWEVAEGLSDVIRLIKDATKSKAIG